MAERSTRAFAERLSGFRHCQNAGECLGTLLCLAEAFKCGPGLRELQGFEAQKKVCSLMITSTYVLEKRQKKNKLRNNFSR